MNSFRLTAIKYCVISLVFPSSLAIAQQSPGLPGQTVPSYAAGANIQSLEAQLERTNAIVLKLGKAMVERQSNCEQTIAQFQTELVKLATVIDSLRLVGDPKQNKPTETQIINQVIELATEDARQPNGTICLSEMIKRLQIRMDSLAIAIQKPGEHRVVKPQIPGTPERAPELPGSLPNPVVPASATSQPIAHPRAQTGLPFDLISANRLSLCEGAVKISACQTFVIGGRRFHGDIMENCNGERVLLTH